ncbi:CVNH domain-containing protein [Aspergillus granulosus]|uniref:CVNH domain-containing protein n=1 Tax=Aspergillus granulosus TaxID=176169 RepID=A0ABR4H405_9EURO
MASQDYYSDAKRFDGAGPNPIPPSMPAPEQAQPSLPQETGPYQPQYYPGTPFPLPPQLYYQYQYQYPPTGYGQQYQQPPPPYPQLPDSGPQPYSPPQPGYAPTATDPEGPTAADERGVLGAVAGGAAGAYAGHQVHHGVLGTIGGAIVGSLAEDAVKNKTSGKEEKKEKKEKKSRFGFHRRGSSSSSSDSDKEEAKKPEPASPPPTRRGNFSASSSSISLRGGYELVASCRSRSGHQRESRLPLNSVLMNAFGHFQWRRNGNFGASARNARLIEGGRVLEAELADGRGGWTRDWVRLDERISNNDGNLVFLD